jgi:hypothetical protein
MKGADRPMGARKRRVSRVKSRILRRKRPVRVRGERTAATELGDAVRSIMNDDASPVDDALRMRAEAMRANCAPPPQSEQGGQPNITAPPAFAALARLVLTRLAKQHGFFGVDRKMIQPHLVAEVQRIDEEGNVDPVILLVIDANRQ